MKYVMLIYQGSALEEQAALPEAEQKQVHADEIDLRWPNVAATELRFEESWPPYQLPEDATLTRTLVDAAQDVSGIRPRLKVAGPSNIGNYLATLGIPATAGYGLRYEGLHGTNERIQIASIPTTEAAYTLAIMRLLGLDTLE